MDFNKLVDSINTIDVRDKSAISNIVNAIDINSDNFDMWAENVFSEKIRLFDMGKLPYLIDELYTTNDNFKFMLCCMLLESTCDKLDFVTPLEKYTIFADKFEMMLNTLVTVYDTVDNGIANCMALIIINNDPKFKYFDDELKMGIINATRRKLNDILNYLKTKNVDPAVYFELEVIVDLACYLHDIEISELIDEIDKWGFNNEAEIFIMKYKIINKISIASEKLNILKNDKNKILSLYQMMERLNVNNIYMNNITQEELAKANLIKWLKYPTELGSAPDEIELLGEFIFNDTKCYAYSFSKQNFKISGKLLGIAGGYPIDKISSFSNGYTFSKFEVLLDDWEKQSRELAQFIYNYWESKKEK